MNITTEIVDAFIHGDDMDRFSDEWYYSIYPYTLPERTGELVEKISFLLREIMTTSDVFYPVNASVWAMLFPDWKEHLDDIAIDLIVGFPKPYDAVMTTDPDGRFHIIFDLNCWSYYVGKRNVSQLIRNFFTHEFCHVMLHRQFPLLSDVEEHGGYVQQLDALTFDEGFAHLLSYNAKEMGDVDWDDDELNHVYEKSRERLCEVLEETDEEQQKHHLISAISGRYYDKYACMCGMLYLAKVWKAGGNDALKQVYDEGYSGFAWKSVGGVVI